MAAGPGRADERPEPILPESRPRRNAWGAGVLLALLTVGGALLRTRELAQRRLWVEQSRQARMYSQFEALLLITLTVVIRMARRRPPSRVPWIGLGVLEASLYWTSQAGLAAWAGQILGVWWLRRSVVAVPLGEAPA